jgi:putative membrane protein
MRRTFVVLASLCLLLTGSFTPTAGAQERNLSPAGISFMKDAASAGLMEIRLGRVAQEKGNSQEVKDYGAGMVIDHSRAHGELQAIAALRNLKLPTQLERKDMPDLVRLSKLSGKEFDKHYLQTMVRHHHKNIARFKKAVQKVQDQDLKAWTVATLPMLQEHLQTAKDVTHNLP